MNNIITYLNLIFICLCFSFGQYFLAINILGQKVKKRNYLLFLVIFTLIQLLMNYVLVIIGVDGYSFTGMKSFLWNIVLYSLHGSILVGLLVKTYNTNILKSITAVALAHFVTFNMLTLCIEFVTNKMPAATSIYTYLLFLNIIPYLFAVLISVAIALFLRKIGFDHYFGVLFISKGRAVIVVLGSLFLMNFYTIYTLFFPVRAETTSVTIYAGVFIILTLFGLQFVAFHLSGQEKLKMQAEIIGQQQEYLSLLEELQQEMRTFRHDFTNLIAGMTEQVRDGDLGGIREFMQGTSTYFDEKLGNEIRHLEGLSNIKLYPLRSLITTKTTMIQQLGLNYTIEVKYPVTKSVMRQEDLIRCVGIVIDNAIEATRDSEQKAIDIVLLQNEKELYVAVANTYHERPDLVKMKGANYSTKGGQRGIGLSSMRKIVAEYPSCLTRMSIKEERFVGEIRMLYAREESRDSNIFM